MLKQPLPKLYRTTHCVVKTWLNNTVRQLPITISLICAVSCAPQAIADTDGCETKTNLSVEITKDQAALALDWKRAIDQDKAEDLWRLMPHVDVLAVNDKGKTALMAAAKIGDRCLLEALLQQGLKVRDRSSTGGTALMYAVLGNDPDMIAWLLPQTSNIDAKSTNGWTAVMIAAAKGFDKAIARLVTSGADPNIADVYQWSPLMRAIDNRHTSVVNYLLSIKTLDVNNTNENGSSSLHIAATAGDIDTARQLINLGIDTSLLDKNGFSAEKIAIEEGHSNIADLIRQSIDQ